MSPFIVLIVVLLAALLVCFLLWRRESRAAGAPLSITGLAIPLLVVAVAGLGYLTIGLDRNTLDWLADQRRYDPVAERVIAGEAPKKLAGAIRKLKKQLSEDEVETMADAGRRSEWGARSSGWCGVEVPSTVQLHGHAPQAWAPSSPTTRPIVSATQCSELPSFGCVRRIAPKALTPRSSHFLTRRRRSRASRRMMGHSPPSARSRTKRQDDPDAIAKRKH